MTYLTATPLAGVPAPARSGLFDDPKPAFTVLVFRTTVSSEQEVAQLRHELDDLTGLGGRWTFDLEDRDRVLRVEGHGPDALAITRALRVRGHECSELE